MVKTGWKVSLFGSREDWSIYSDCAWQRKCLKLNVDELVIITDITVLEHTPSILAGFILQLLQTG